MGIFSKKESVADVRADVTKRFTAIQKRQEERINKGKKLKKEAEDIYQKAVSNIDKEISSAEVESKAAITFLGNFDKMFEESK